MISCKIHRLLVSEEKEVGVFRRRELQFNARQEEIVFRHDTVLCGQDSVVATPQCDGLTSLERW